MHRNTKILFILLAAFAAVVAGVNIAKINLPDQPQQPTQPTPAKTPVPTPTAILSYYQSSACSLSFRYSGKAAQVDIENGGSTLASDNGETLTILCQPNLPRPKDLSLAKPFSLGTVSAQLVTAESTESGQTTNRLFFRHPNKNITVSISGSTSLFSQMLESVIIE